MLLFVILIDVSLEHKYFITGKHVLNTMKVQLLGITALNLIILCLEIRKKGKNKHKKEQIICHMSLLDKILQLNILCHRTLSLQ